MNNFRETPTNITANRNTGELTIHWADEQECVYPFNLLRAACPCAECRGGHQYMTSEPDPAVYDENLPDSPATHLKKIEAVGSYAILIEWEDGHRYGIFNWHYLRTLCRK